MARKYRKRGAPGREIGGKGRSDKIRRIQKEEGMINESVKSKRLQKRKDALGGPSAHPFYASTTIQANVIAWGNKKTGDRGGRLWGRKGKNTVTIETEKDRVKSVSRGIFRGTSWEGEGAACR